LLLAGAALVMPDGGAHAQTLRRYSPALGGTHPDHLFAGIWATSPDDRPGDDAYFQLSSVSGDHVNGIMWASEATGAREAGDLSLQRVAPDRLTGTMTAEGRQLATVEITAPAGKSYMLLTMTTPRGKLRTYLQAVSSVGAAIPALHGSAVAQAMLGDWHTPHGILSIDVEGTMLRGVLRGPNGSARATQFRAHSPQAVRHSWRYGSSDNDMIFVLSPDGKQFQVSDWRAHVGGLQNWEGNRVSSEPAQNPPPAPAPAPAPFPPIAEAPEAPGTAQAGTFHSLEAFDVRLDEAKAARDGTVHLFLTVRNDSGREQQIGAGTFTTVMSDADGVGVREAQIWRAGGETPTQFDRPPVVPAGGEFKFRFVLTPPTVHAPLQRVSIRESDRKVLFFSVAGADPNPSRAVAPAQGGGAFKSLSKFDVRIDRVSRARDGLLEAFLTLRNPGTAVETISKGWIKLSGSDADGAKGTSRSALYSVRGERGNYDELPLLVYVEPGQQVRLRYVFDQAISGPITISDGTTSQTFTAG
jgi:hypothetical protein